MSKDCKIFIFCNKINRILSYISLLVIPIFIYLLILRFHTIFLITFLLITFLLVVYCYRCNTFQLKLYEDKIVIREFKKHTFVLIDIQNLIMEDKGQIKIVYEDDVYRFVGFKNILGVPNKEKNKELVKLISDNIKKVRYGEINRVAFKDIEVIAQKKVWTLAFLVSLFYGFVDLVCIFSLILEWSILMLWVILVLSSIIFPILFHKIFSPTEKILYDSEKKTITIKKTFKTITKSLTEFKSFDYSGKYNRIIFKIKSKRSIIVYGVSKIFEVKRRLCEIVQYSPHILFTFEGV